MRIQHFLSSIEIQQKHAQGDLESIFYSAERKVRAIGQILQPTIAGQLIVATSDPVVEDGRPLEEIEEDTPPWADNEIWLSPQEVVKADSGVNCISTLWVYRSNGRKTGDQMFGINSGGRIWRRRPDSTRNSRVFYWRESLSGRDAPDSKC